MTQQPYYPPQQPQAPAPTYPPQYPQAPQAPQPGYPQQPYQQPAPNGYPQQAYPPPYPPQAPPAPPLAQGSLDEFYSQPSAGSGPGIGWTDANKQPRPLGTTWVGVVVRDVTNADVQQVTDIRTNQPVFYRDGRPKFQMKVPLRQVALFADPGLTQQLPLPADMPEAEATWYVKGQTRDELTRAMAEAGVEGAPRTGAVVVVTLVNRRPNGGGLNPSNIVQVRYHGSASEQPVQAPPAPQPVQPTLAQQVQQGIEQGAQQGYAPQPQQAPQQPQYQPSVQQAPAPQQPVQQPVQQGAPPQFNEEQAALFARITGGQQPPQQGQPAA